MAQHAARIDRPTSRAGGTHMLPIMKLLGRFGLLTLPESLKVLENPWLIGLSGLLLVVELLADKIQLVDSIWDSVHTFIRIPAGAVLAALALGDHDPAIMVAAGLLGGSLTAGVHALKAGSRALINTSPEPLRL